VPTVTYLGVEIVVRAAQSDYGEIACVKLDGEDHCFLGGEPEARRWLRERRYGARTGPRPATWWIELDSGCVASYSTHAAALGDSGYWQREGRTHKLVRVEYCRMAGCDGHGTISEHGRRNRPCSRHEDAEQVVELDWCSGT
jgi:hypothetical protein